MSSRIYRRYNIVVRSGAADECVFVGPFTHIERNWDVRSSGGGAPINVVSSGRNSLDWCRRIPVKVKLCVVGLSSTADTKIASVVATTSAPASHE